MLSVDHFLKSENGSFAPVLVFALIPLIAVVGFSVDYTSAVSTRSSMQSALDAAALSITTLKTDTSLVDREKKMQESYAANGGEGTAKLDSFVVANDGTANINASAGFAMPTDFMSIAQIDTVPIAVASRVVKRPALVEATFKVNKISGYWDKTMTLYGTKFNETAANKLMKITYAHNKFGDPKGYGTANVYTISGSTETLAQKQVCTTAQVNNFNNLPTGAITQTSGSKKYVTTCVNTMYPANGAGAVIDVSLMDKLYLEMKIPNPNPGINNGNLPTGTKTTLRSDDSATSNRLYLDGVEVLTGQQVDIFTAVPCGLPSIQAWEDGGSAVPTAANIGSTQADFFYTVTGKCAFNQRASETVLTQ